MIQLALKQITLGWHHQDSDIDCTQLQSASQEGQLATIYTQDTILKIPEPKKWDLSTTLDNRD